MKTRRIKTAKWQKLFIVIAIALFTAINGFGTEPYRILTGKIIDKTTLAPIVFANINLLHTHVGTITNNDGEFVLKVPTEADKVEIEVSHLGYQTRIIPQNNLTDKRPQPILLEEKNIELNEVMISNLNPFEIVQKALLNINENYLTIPERQTAFYRETFKKNSQFKGVTEAVIEVYKSRYDHQLEQDRIRILKARKQLNVKQADTLMFKLQGGPTTSYMLDFVKNPILLLGDIALKEYNFTSKKFTTIDDKTCFVIEFSQKKEVEEPRYTGQLFIETNSLAFVGARFEITPDKLDKAAEYMITKKPTAYKVARGERQLHGQL